MIAQALLWLWLISLSIITLWSYWLNPNADMAAGWQGVVYVLAPLTAVVAGLVAVRQFGLRSAQGKALALIVLGVVAWCVGEVLWTYYDLVAHTDPYPSLADVFYLFAYLPLAVGFIWELKFLRQHVQVQKPGVQHILFAVIAVLLAVLAGYFGVYQAYKPEVVMLENIVAISYGLADVVLIMFGLVIAVVAVELRGGKMARPWWWILAGLSCIFIADIAFAMFTSQYELQTAYYKPALDSLWILGYLALAYGFHQYSWLIQSVQQYLQSAAERAPLHQAKKR